LKFRKFQSPAGGGETVKTVGSRFWCSITLLKQGVNEKRLALGPSAAVLHFFTYPESHNEMVSDKGKVWGHLVPEK
jgi:hypothetical protein